MLRSARELVVERGVEATTVTAIAARSGVSRATIGGDVVFDLIVGSLLNAILATGEAPGPEYVRQLTAVILQGLRTPMDDVGSRVRGGLPAVKRPTTAGS